MPNIITRLQDGTWTAERPFVITCGCGSIVPDAKSIMRQAQVDVPFVVSASNWTVKEYIKQMGLDQRVPSLARNKHAVLYNPSTTRYINLMEAPHNETTYNNIRRVVNNG